MLAELLEAWPLWAALAIALAVALIAFMAAMEQEAGEKLPGSSFDL